MTAVEPGPVRQQAGPPEWFKPGKSSRSRSHVRSRSTASTRSHVNHADYSSDSVSDSDSSSDDTRSGKVSYREWMQAGSRVKKDETGHRLIWGYENIHEQLAEDTPLVLKEREIKRREEAERQKRRKERKEQRRAEKEERRKRRKKEKEDKALERIKEEEPAETRTDSQQSSKKYDLKEAAKQTREAQKAAGHVTSTVQGKSILLNVLQSTLHENRVRDGDLIDRARVVFKQAGYDEGGKRDVKLLSAHLNSGIRPPSPRRPRGEDDTDDVAEVVPIVSYEEFKHRKHEAKTEDRKAKIKAKMKEQKAKVQAFMAAQEKEKMAHKSAEHAGTKSDSREKNEISASVDLLLASVSASLESKKKSSRDLTAALWATDSAPSSFVPPPPDFPPPDMSATFPFPPLPPFPHLPS